MNMKLPDINVKKMMKEAGSTFSRVVQVGKWTNLLRRMNRNLFAFDFQLTEEKLGTSERTEFDGHLESLAERADATKNWTEKILRNTEAVLTPNPGNRAEDYLFEKIEKKKPIRLSNLEYLGLDMIEVSQLKCLIECFGLSFLIAGRR